MPGPAKPFGTPGAPQPRGRPKLTPEVREARDIARIATPDMVRRLIRIAQESDDDKAVITACNAILDRGMGKPVQEVTGEDGEPIRIELSPVIFIPPESSD